MSEFSDLIEDYSFELPENLIAQTPSPHRSDAKLLLVRRNPQGGLPRFENLKVSELPGVVASSNELQQAYWVRNRSKVFPARFYAHRPTGSRHEIVLIEPLSDHRWRAIIRGVSSFKYPQALNTGTATQPLSFRCLEPGILEFSLSKSELISRLWEFGEMPLPPYIKNRDPVRDKERYQSVWADQNHSGSSAAPTASLHFDDLMQSKLQSQGVEFIDTYLHVGLGTFEPMRVPRLSEHSLHSERFLVPPSSLQKLRSSARAHLAIGTTALRTLETTARFCNSQNAQARAEAQVELGLDGTLEGQTRLFVRPGFEFQATNFLWTNFHLPESTLFVLVSCFAGSPVLAKEAYQWAIRHNYRFFSYGDASLWI